MSDGVELPIRLRRRRIGLSQGRLAHLAGVPQGSLSRLERGEGAEHLDTRVRSVLASAEAQFWAQAAGLQKMAVASPGQSTRGDAESG